MTTSERFSISTADWQQERVQLQQIRREVFIIEQSVPEELEWDGRDDDALHLKAISAEGNIIGTARLLSDAHIGRVAVVREWRSCGVGTAMMMDIFRQAERLGYRQLELAAQISAIPFYEKLGFECHGEAFMDAGIPHINMSRDVRSR
ncbi:MAG: GNAT family N-acetyltransferase [Gammaproteobacteria bacterium]|nr:GNAT family N-acetyltransferase [Gammaproteobacteria bacterium]